MINPDETLFPLHIEPNQLYYEFYRVIDQALDRLRQQPDDEYLRATVISEAYLIARHHLPPGIADQLGIPDGQIHQHMDEGRPTLRAILILLRSYDATGNDHLREIVEYMLDNANSSFIDFIRTGYSNAHMTDPPQPPFKAYENYIVSVDNVLDGKKSTTTPLSQATENAVMA